MSQMQALYNEAYEVQSQAYPLIDYVSYVTEKGMSFDGARKLLMISLDDMKKNLKSEENRRYVMPNHKAAKAVYVLRINQYERQLTVMNTLEKEENKIDKQIISELKKESLPIVNDIQKPQFKPDYTRAIIIGGAIFTALMLLLIWRVRK
jgi:hypothetical protein